MARLLIEAGNGINDHNIGGKTPLHLAALYSSVRVVEELLRHGAAANLSSRDYSSTREDGQTALFYATDPKRCKPRNSEIIIRLLQHGADVNKMGRDSLTALSLAAKNGSVSQVQLFLDRGAVINPQATSSVLHSAVRAHQTQIVSWLLTRGADVNHRDQDNETPLYDAIRAFQPTSICGYTIRFGVHFRFVSDTDMVRRLLNAGANTNCRNTQGLTPLSIAADLSLVAIIKMLIEHGADIHAKDNGGQAPLHKAVQIKGAGSMGDPLGATRMLIKQGADPNARDVDGYTPVHIAAEGYLCPKSQELLRVLLHAGGAIHARSNDGKTPKDMVLGDGGDSNFFSSFFAHYGA